MTLETNELNLSNPYVKAVTSQFNRGRVWIRCPRCVTGNMYHLGDGEYVCMLCGRSYYPDKVNKAPNAANVADGNK